MTADSPEPAGFDAFADGDDCRQRRVKPGVIGAPRHTHVCREAQWHDGAHICICGERF